MRTAHEVAPVDAFDLPEWLGEHPVTWTALGSLTGSHLVAGALAGESESLDCDLLACDLAYPAPVLDESWRAQAHHLWSLGQALLIEYDGRLTLVVPGSAFTAEPVLEAVRRLAKAVGAPADRFTVALRL